jgi:starch-binding outer membrane protein, SusD/RagB family
MSSARTRYTSSVVATAVFLAFACSSLVDVSSPDAIQPQSLGGPTGAEALRAGALARFYIAAAGYWIRQVALRSDELWSTRAGGLPWDQRLPISNDDDHTSAARVDALLAIAAFQQSAPTLRVKIGQMYAVIGYTEIMFAEGNCSGQPLSQIVNGQPEFGAPMTTAQLFTEAVKHADSALVYASTDPQIGSLARVIKGRALLGLGRSSYDAAAAAVASVPNNFVYQTENNTTTQLNNLANAWQAASFKEISVADKEGVNGYDYISANDPRITVTNVGKGADGVSTVWAFNRYLSVSAPVVLASGTEARLIEAEVQLKNGQLATALATLNALRTTVPGLAPLTLQATAAQQVDQIFRERAFWMFGTGHRFGDMRRLIRQYGRGAETVFPTGPYRDGLVYGTEIPYLIRPSEAYNPNANGGACLDKNP